MEDSAAVVGQSQIRRAFLGGRSGPRLLLTCHFGGSAVDGASRSTPFSLRNTEYREHGLYVDERYEFTEDGFHAVGATPALGYDAFSVAVRFKPADFVGNHLNIVTGGTSYRWFSLCVNESGRLSLSLNNGDLLKVTGYTVRPKRWTTVGCAVDVPARRVTVFADGRRVADLRLREDFELRVASYENRESDKVWTFTDYGSGETFHGIVSDMVVYDGV